MKKLISIILALTVLFTCFGCVMSVAAADYNHLPQIYVNGIGSRAIYYKDDPDKTSLFYPVETQLLIDNLKKLPDYIGEAVLEDDPDILYSCVYSWAMDSFGMVALEPDGITSKENVTIDPCPLDYIGNGEYSFNYDSRIDPVDLAHQLQEYVGWVQEHSGSERFELVGSSYGASIVAAYLAEYPEMKPYIDSVVLCVPSLPGVDFVGEVFSGKIEINPDTLQTFLKTMVKNEDIDLVVSVLQKSNVLAPFISFGLEPTLRLALKKALKDVIHDSFGAVPAMWTFVQDKYFYDALEYIYGEDYTSENHEYAGLIRRITYYHENVMVKAPEILKQAQQDGIHVSIISKYGLASIPLSSSENVLSDSLVDLEDATFGATCSLNGETLPEDYAQALYPDYNFLSADGCIDASTGALPFNTWYIKNLEHGVKPDAYFEMIDRIAYDNLDVFSDEKYPQFLEVSKEDNNILSPLTADTEEESNFFTDFFKLIKRVYEILSVLVQKLFTKE